MERLSRVELQARNRARVLTAARDEFAERGFRDAKIDAIAERAGLTRGAVYSNFPGKRALYFAVLAELAEGAAPPAAGPRGGDGASPDGGVPRGVFGAGGPARDGAPQAAGAREALAAFARAWVSRLPLATDGPGRIGMDLMPEIMADEGIRKPFAQLMKLSGVLLGLALEEVAAGGGRMVRVAEVTLTTLHGMSQMADAAPGFVEEFDVVSACERLADLDLGDRWDPPHLPWAAPARPADAPWAPPAAADALRGGPAPLSGDGVVAVVGLHRLGAVEEAVRAARAGDGVTAVLVTGDPGELGPLVRLVVADLRGCLREAFPRTAWPRLGVVFDERGTVAAAAGVPAVSDGTETAVRVRAGRVVARADGHGACHSAASAAGP